MALPEHYAALSDDSAGITERLDTIRKIAWPIMLRKSQSRRLEQHPPGRRDEAR